MRRWYGVRILHLPPATPPFTKADWDRLPEGFPAQLVEGWLVKEPSPRYGHQRLALEIRDLLVQHVARALVVCAPFDVELDELNVYQPDVVVLRRVPADDERCQGAPLLVAEVLSPSTAQRDREIKRRHLRAAGTDEVWLVDPEARSIEVHDALGVRRSEGGAWLTSRAVPGFRLSAAALFVAPPG